MSSTRAKQMIDEIMTGGMIATPAPMLVGTEPSAEYVHDDDENERDELDESRGACEELILAIDQATHTANAVERNYRDPTIRGNLDTVRHHLKVAKDYAKHVQSWVQREY